jgi:hypothetical protein
LSELCVHADLAILIRYSASSLSLAMIRLLICLGLLDPSSVVADVVWRKRFSVLSIEKTLWFSICWQK